MRKLIRHVTEVLVSLVVVSIVGGSWAIYTGWYNVSALEQHTAPVYAVIDYALRRSLAVRAEAVDVPPEIALPAWQQAGLVRYRGHCRQCHGAPGEAPDYFALGMKPVPPPIVEVARKRTPGEIYWAIAHGIKMTGMPAWRYRMTETEIWQIVAFIERSKELSRADYQAMVASAPASIESDKRARQGKLNTATERGRRALHQYGCVSCHVIPGVTGAISHLGPPLSGMAQRAFIAGVLSNTRENMIRWVQAPQEVDPLTTMPPLGVTRQDAADIADYLYSLE